MEVSKVVMSQTGYIKIDFSKPVLINTQRKLNNVDEIDKAL